MNESESPRPYQIRLLPSFWERVDAWRREQPSIPTRAEAIRQLVELGLDAAAKKTKR